MKKGIVIAVLAVFSMFAVAPAFAAIGADGKLTIDKPADKFPKNKLNADGTKKKGPVTFNHTAHGAAMACSTCHHTEKAKEAELKAGTYKPAKLCFECHGPEASADGKQLDTYKMIHEKGAMCIDCHKTDAKAMEKKAPTACKGCHGGE